jgi:hypothetical protein
MNTNTTISRNAKKAAKKTTPKVVSKPSGESATPAPSDKNKSVLTPMSIENILKFTGGDPSTVIEVSRKSLVDAKTKGARAAAAKELADFGLNDDL